MSRPMTLRACHPMTVDFAQWSAGSKRLLALGYAPSPPAVLVVSWLDWQLHTERVRVNAIGL